MVRRILTALPAKSKKQRRIASKAARARSGNASQSIAVPLHEQSIDLPAGSGEEQTREAQDARDNLTKSMRNARRKKIKEANFLRGMR